MARPEALLFFMFQILNLTPTLSTLFSLLAPFGKCLFIFDTSGRRRQFSTFTIPFYCNFILYCSLYTGYLVGDILFQFKR